MPLSMTGFARQENPHSWGLLACEIRSVNHRYLDLTIKAPESLHAIEPTLRESIKNALNRGKVEVAFYLRIDKAENQELVLNKALFDKLVDLAESSSKLTTNAAPLNPIDILKWPGVVVSAEIDKDQLAKAALDLFKHALEKLQEARQREGEELAKFINQRLAAIDKHVEQTKKSLPLILESHQQKLEEKLAALEIEIDKDRLAQELVYIAQKSDVAEELDRLVAHLSEVRRTLKQNGPIGRRLDFLMQELNREANTLSSKSIAVKTTTSAVDLKVLIEQMREQIQNIE